MVFGFNAFFCLVEVATTKDYSDNKGKIRQFNMYTVSVQPSFQEVINDVLQDRLKEDQFWINFVEIEDAEDGPVKEEIVSVNKEDQNLVFGNKNGLKFNKIDDHHYKIDYQGFEFKISASTKTYKSSIKGELSYF